MRFNPPPNWPVEPGWAPAPDWQPPAEWGEPPSGWELWLSDAADHPATGEDPPTAAPAAPEASTTTDDSVPPAEPHTDEAATTFERHDPRGRPAEPKVRKGLAAKALQNPIWATLGALVGVAGLVLSSVEVYQAMRTPPVDLEIAAVTVDAQQSLQGTVAGGNATTRSIELTPIDLTLQNKGGEPSLITDIEAEVVYFRQLRDCTGAQPAPESFTAKYDLAIPMVDVEPAEKQLSHQIRFEVKPGAADRLVLTLGPQTQSAFATTPMVMSAKIRLIHDDDQTVDVGTVSLVTTVGAATAQIDSLGSSLSPSARTCAQENLAHLDEMFTIQAKRSRVLDDLRSAYQRAGA